MTGAIDESFSEMVRLLTRWSLMMICRCLSETWLSAACQYFRSFAWESGGRNVAS